MAGLEEVVSLDIAEALAQADTLAQSAGEALEASFSAALESLSSLFATATGDLQEQLASAVSDVPLAVTADTSQAETAIDQVVSTADSEVATIPVEADTSDAQSAIDDLAASADDATVSVGSASGATGGLADSTALLSGAAGLAAGNVGGLGDVASGLSTGTAAAVGGVLALAGGVGVLFQKGLDATSALQRFNTIVGDMADKVLNVHVGSLNGQLDDLAIKLGTDDEAMRNASASIFQFAINSGAGREQAATFTNQVDALALRAVALNPALGSAADVAEGMTRKLATGGPRAISYGLALTSAQISAEAMRETHKTTEAELTTFDKAVAGAKLSVGQYGDTLNTTVANGAKNAAIEQRSLKEQLDNILETAGKPLVVPVLEAFKDSQPAVEAFASSLGEVAVDALPLLTGGLEAAIPVLQAAAFVLKTVTDLTEQAGTTSIVAGAALGAAFGGAPGALIGAAAGAIAGLTKAFDDSGESADEYRIRLSQLAAELQGLGPKAAAAKFDLSNIEAGKLTVDETIKSLHDLATVSPTTAKIVLQGLEEQDAAYRQQGIATEFTEGAHKRLRSAVESGTSAYVDNAQRSKEVATADRALADGIDTAGSAALKFNTALEAEQKLLDDLNNRLLGVPGAANNYSQAVQGQAEAQQNYNDALAKYGFDSDEARAAALRLDSAQLQVGTSLLALDKAQKDANETIGTATPQALQDDIAHLNDLIRTNPAAAASLQPIVDQLQKQLDLLNFLKSLGPVGVTVTADTAQAEAALERLSIQLGGLPIAQFGFVPFAVNAAAGEVVHATPGGQIRRVAEAGYDEIIVPANDPVRAASLLTAGGLGQLLAPRISTPASVSSSHHDQSITIEHIDARGAPDPVKVGKTVARKLRTAQYLGGWS